VSPFNPKPWFQIAFISLMVGSATVAYTASNASAINVYLTETNPAYLPIVSKGPDAGQRCPDSYHNPDRWHPLVDPGTGCYYGHEHKHDPNQVNDIFGPPGAWFGGTSISYPWETPHENHEKHEAYGWIVRRDIPSHNRETWIQAFRLQVHATSAPFTSPEGALHGGYLARFHSYSLEAQACNNSGQCGLVRTGGWIDFGNLEIAGYGAIPLPGEEEAVADLGRRRIHYFHLDPERRKENQFGAPFFWYGRQRPDSLPWDIVPLNPLLIALSTHDAAVNVDPERLYQLLFFCPEYDCNKNDSTIQAHVVQFAVPNAYADSNGRVNLAAYTNRYGQLVTGCTILAVDCIPLIIAGAPATSGPIQHRDDTHLVDHPTSGYDDFDTSPPGQWWIGYPN
jgi:hypothetical protein